MAIAPSNNLLNALSQLQGSARPAAPARPAQQSPQAGGTSQVQNSFAAQLANTDNAIRTQAAPVQSAPAQSFAAAVQSQPRPIPTRGGYLGQHVNIVV